MLLLLYVVVESFDLGFVEVLEFVLVFPVLPHQVVLDVLVFCLNEVELVDLLLLKLLEFIFIIGRLDSINCTSALSSSLLSLICLLRFSISKFFSSMVSLSLRMFSSWISLLPFWERLRFCIWAIDSLSYWFLRRCSSSLRKFSASTASFWRRVICVGGGVPLIGAFRFVSGALGP